MKNFTTADNFAKAQAAASNGDLVARLEVTAFHCRTASGELFDAIVEQESLIPMTTRQVLAPAARDLMDYLQAEDGTQPFDAVEAAALCGRVGQALVDWDATTGDVALLNVITEALGVLAHVQSKLIEALGLHAQVMADARAVREAGQVGDTISMIARADAALNAGASPVPVLG